MRVDQFAHLAMLPILRSPGQHLVCVARVQHHQQSPADQRYVEPSRAGRRLLDEAQDEIDQYIGGEMAVERLERADAAPRPLLELGGTGCLARARSGAQLDRFAIPT